MGGMGQADMGDAIMSSMRSFMSAPIDEYYLEALRKYFLASGDKRSKIVDFTGNGISPFLKGSETIGLEDFTIIDSFDGRKPIVLNYRFLVEGHPIVPLLAGIAPDSNVVYYLHKLVTDESGKFTTTARGRSTEQLLKRLAQYSLKGWDFNPFFYVIEAFSKNKFDETFPWARACAESMLRIQAMDDEVYLRSGKIVSHPENLEPGSGDFQTASHNMA